MPFINLIEEQRLARRREQAKARTGLLSLGGVTGLAFLACGFLWIAGESVDGDIARMENEAHKVKPLQDQIDSVNSSISVMSPKLTTLENARELTSKWDRVLNHLTSNTPRDIWLTGVRCMATDPTKPIDVNFQGVGSQLQTIGEFILRMQGSEDLESVSLKFTQEKLIDQRVGIEFDVTAALEGTADETKAKDATEEGSE